MKEIIEGITFPELQFFEIFSSSATKHCNVYNYVEGAKNL